MRRFPRKTINRYFTRHDSRALDHHSVRSRGRRTKRRRVAWLVTSVGLAIVVFLGIAALLTIHTYDQVKGSLQQAQATLTALAHNPKSLNSAIGRAGVRTRLQAAATEIANSQAEIKSSAGLQMLGLLPGFHAQRIGLNQLVGDLESTTQTSLALLRSVSELAAHSHGTHISLPDLRSLSAELGRARTALTAMDRPVHGLWGPIGTDRRKFNREDQRAVQVLDQGLNVIRYAIPFLGGGGSRMYLVMGENNAEMRDQGSPLSYSLMTANNGSLTIVNGGSVGTLGLSAPVTGVPISPGTQTAFGALLPTLFWQNTNATADFAFSGRAMQAMFARATGRHVDGVIGLDVPALQSVLKLTGPIAVPGISELITSGNAAQILLRQLYQGLGPRSSEAPRREELGAVTSAAIHKLEGGSADLVGLARTAAADVGERHILIWDEKPAFEQTLRELGAAGAIDTNDPGRTFHIAVENATATKLDYYVDVAISDTVYLQQDRSVIVSTLVQLTNRAPAGRPASYQLGPDAVNSAVSGEYVGRVFMWGPAGSSQLDSVPESGLLLAHEQDLVVLPGQSASARFTTVIPRAIRHGKLQLVLFPQPRLRPDRLTIHVVDGKLAPGSQAQVSTVITKTVRLTWTLAH